ncbi:aminotransferase class III-fold pyridoxal phosphate-dependent enzyme [Aestuariivirga sp.]|uniref:aminotransferase class III-fold pyridoxal phosphate-dependent enzyme n=1 Tax=Aestuariivirga sp. TaxID=2650926 RepID=UPI0037836147
MTRPQRIAFIWPNDGLNDDEFWAYVPPGVSWLTTRYPGTLEGHGLDRETFLASAELGPMIAAARLMRPLRPDVVALGDHAGSFIKGIGGDEAQAAALAEAAGAPHATTPATAMVAALRHLNARRIAVTSPYDREVTDAGIAFLEAHGFEVVAVERESLTDEHEIASRDAWAWRDLALKADHREAEAIALFGCGIRTAGMLPDLEMAAGKPAVPATAALVWHACSLAGMRPSKPGLGRLFAPLVPEFETQHLHHALGLHLSTGTKSFALSRTPPLFVSGAGTWLTDTQGRHYLDFACGSGTTVLGHGHPAVMRAIREQLDSGVTHLGPHFHAPVQIRLMERLASVLPSELGVFHPVTNGTEAVEAALKAAIHATGRRRFIAFEGAYHGRTLGSLALSHARGSNAVLGTLVPDTTHLPYPLTAENASHLTARLGEELARGDVAAVIAEPVQATAGMRVPAPGWLHAVRKATEKAGTLLIMDEVFTGYGRTGRLFGFEWSDEVSRTGIVPDLLVLGKAASGGIPGAILAGRRDILQGWKPGVQSSTFQMHPVSAAASLAVLEELIGHDYPARALAAGERMRAAIGAEAAHLPGFGGISGVGAMIGVAVTDPAGDPDQELTRAIRAKALGEGLITWECGTHGHVIGLVPPLTVSDGEIDRAAGILGLAFRRAR